jgi:hypothetical protein
MKIGISLNNVLRGYFHQIEDVYDKYFPGDEEDEDYDGLHVKDYDLEKWITFPEEEVTQGEMEFNPEFNEDTFMKSDETTEVVKKTTQVTLDEFLYERCTLEIFGYADEIGNAMEVVNNLMLDYPDIEFIIMSRELGLSIPSTYFFLSKTSCMCQNIKFVTDNKDHWEHVDIMVTDHPDIINSKPEGKGVIKVNWPHNETAKADWSIDSIHELPTKLDSLFNANIK